MQSRASCECLYSSFSFVLARLRTRLSINDLVNLAELKMYIRDEHARDKDAQKAVRQRFFGHKQDEGTSGDVPSQMAASQNQTMNEAQQRLASGEGDAAWMQTLS